jgi:hypothetical protein
MGVMTVSSQNFMEIDMPGWWLSGASVDLDFRNGRYYDSSNILAGLSNLLSISRASIGYAKTSGGTLTQFSSGQFRQTDAGLLIEDARTNLTLQSQDFTVTGSAGWNVSNVTIGGPVAAPDGTTTADIIAEGGTTGVHDISSGQVVGVTSGANYALSVWAKAQNRNYCFLNFEGTTSSQRFVSAVFDLQNGVVGETKVGTTSGTIVSTSIEAFANGCYRCILVGSVADTSAVIAVGPATAATGNTFNGGGEVTFAGASQNSIVAWGVQWELGSFASSYIPTTTTSATRAADSIATAGALSTVIDGVTASVVIDTEVDMPAGGGSGVVSLLTNVSWPRFSLNIAYTGTQHIAADLVDVAVAGELIADSGVVMTSGIAVKSGASWNASGRSLVCRGSAAQTDIVTPQGFSGNPAVGSGGYGQIFGYFRRLTAWNTRLADATLQALTRP